ncbi:glycosyl transferase family 2 [Hydrogenobacter thermophilus TK-6]|uniref:Glycosyltransferase, family 2 n=1 Tax=Hydrogenobacter thermophilus (strain DSM 6534 / IAM 12695 / TK-6) TaxID=608538 RepID=D3DHW9_HYDTT|nr:glycosyltransferase family 2 protein [Hydrogenobacter thermophilus]ADO45354.1 glycosyl transferase family 2 [Hydrogenobacter thermophilus TK-6]BAI69421.1 glycosyltransferase, family 2 [Hydrogenobacter thermophilus TK-6]
MISVVIPAYNEKDSIPILYEKLTKVLEGDYEIIFVDDGSDDGTFEVLQKIAGKDSRVKVIRFRRNYGQTAAMYAGFQHAKGEIIITMDADLQNDPEDIPALIRKLEEGYDLVSGWRKDRKDPFFSRRLPSMIANWIISKVTGVELHDYGCTLKAYRADILKELELYGDMHRFLPALTKRHGAKITEVVVRHHPRLYGKSKYGLGRTIRVILDILLVKFLNEYINKPMYVFGSVGFLLLFTGSLVLAYLILIKLFLGEDIGRRPLLVLSVLSILAGIQLISTGIIAELLVRIYYRSKEDKPYIIDRKINL